MKLIIDIPEEIYKDIMIHNREMRESGKSAYYFEGLIQNGIPIPDNATNSDVIKALFDVTEEHFFEDMVDVYGIDDYVTVGVEWWNAPYQKGGK